MSVAAHMLSFNDNATSVVWHLAAAENVNFNALALVSDKADNSQACNCSTAHLPNRKLAHLRVDLLDACINTASLLQIYILVAQLLIYKYTADY